MSIPIGVILAVFLIVLCMVPVQPQPNESADLEMTGPNTSPEE